MCHAIILIEFNSFFEHYTLSQQRTESRIQNALLSTVILRTFPKCFQKRKLLTHGQGSRYMIARFPVATKYQLVTNYYYDGVHLATCGTDEIVNNIKKG